jgi:hypothetical protein
MKTRPRSVAGVAPNALISAWEGSFWARDGPN